MRARIVAIGTEITRGELTDTNSAHLADALTALGHEVVGFSTVGDDRDRIVATLDHAAGDSDVVLVTGGLGPTTDDLTAACAAVLAGVPLREDPDALDAIRVRFERAGLPMSPNNAKQALFPEGAEILPNPVGTAPGFRLHRGQADLYFMPGVPHEMKRMFDQRIRPRLVAGQGPTQQRLRVFGMTESAIDARLADLEASHPGVTLAYRASFPEIEVKVLGRDAAVVDAVFAHVQSRLGLFVFATGEQTFGQAVGEAVRARGFTIGAAESCSGGRIGEILTAVPGASAYFRGAVVAYHNDVKERVLGVPDAVLREPGAVSRECVIAMAEGARRVLGCDVAVSTSCIAGPTGATSEKPIGLIHAAVATPEGTAAHERRYGGQRHQVQILAAYIALDLARQACRGTLVFDKPSAMG